MSVRLEPPRAESTEVLDEIGRRVLWLATLMIHHANNVRKDAGGVKVGGHQASSASVVTLLTYLFFEFLRPGDRISVKPHAAPVLHAVNYLLGHLDADADHLRRARPASDRARLQVAGAAHTTGEGGGDP